MLPPGHVLIEQLAGRVVVDPGDPESRCRDMRGKWGRLLALVAVRSKDTKWYRNLDWLCACECGEWVVRSAHLLAVGSAVACTPRCFDSAVAAHAEAYGVDRARARVLLLSRTLSPVMQPAKERQRVGKIAAHQLPTDHRPENDYGTGRRRGQTSGATILAIEAAWSITGLPGECTVHVTEWADKRRVPTPAGLAVQWKYTAHVTRVSDGRVMRGSVWDSRHGALMSLLEKLQKDRDTR